MREAQLTPSGKKLAVSRPYPQVGASKERKKETMNITDTMAGRGLEALRAAIAGRVFIPGEAGYDQARQAWNLAVDQRPAVVVEAGSAADVAQAVRFARAH